MKLKVLGCSGSDLPEHDLTAFLLDDFLLLDAGTVGHVLDSRAQQKITHILITHVHLDHIKGLPFFVENLVASNHLSHSVTVISGEDVISDLKSNIFNDRIWPDFTKIPDNENPVLNFQPVNSSNCLEIAGYKVHASEVSHTVPAYGYIIEDRNGKALVYTGDTGPTEMLWRKMEGFNVKALLIEVTFPNSMVDLALKSCHLTPSLLEAEIGKMKSQPAKVYITHLKPEYRDIIVGELGEIRKEIPFELIEESGEVLF